MAKRRHSDPPASRNDDMSESERSALSRIDRYGFFDQALKSRQETRVTLLPSKPFKKVPKLPRQSTSTSSASASTPNHGPSTSQAEEAPSLPLPTVESLSMQAIRKAKVKEPTRTTKWDKMLHVASRDDGQNISSWSWEPNEKRGKKVPERVYKGVPDRWRAAVWVALADRRAERTSPATSRPPPISVEESYRKLLDVPSTFDVQIDLDVPRTISGHTLFYTRYGHG